MQKLPCGGVVGPVHFQTRVLTDLILVIVSLSRGVAPGNVSHADNHKPCAIFWNAKIIIYKTRIDTYSDLVALDTGDMKIIIRNELFVR